METTLMNSEVLKQVSERILLKRRELGISQKDLAVKANVSGPLLVLIEAGKENTSVKKLDQVCTALGMRLIVDVEDMNENKSFV